MIRQLQRRFIRIALITLTIAMVLVTGIVNLVNWLSVRAELLETLNFLVENGSAEGRGGPGGRMMNRSKHARITVSESKWFSVYLNEDGSVHVMNLENMMDADSETAEKLAELAVSRGRETGFYQDHVYKISSTGSNRRMILFLNCETKLAAVRNLAIISGLACLGGILLAWLIVSLASRRAIAPIIRSMEQQKRFITDASHELKTPLTVISTNMQLLNGDLPGNQWIRSTLKQTAQMRHLVEEMTYLSRMEEEYPPLTMETLSLDALLRETAEPFVDMSEFAGKRLTVDADRETPFTGARASIPRAISNLLDNAVNYAAPEGEIRAEVQPEGRWAVMRISNPVTTPLTKEQCSRLFDRFYRADPSRNKDEKSGYGIGLAIAAAIIEKHGGQIQAAMEGERLVFTCRMNKK